MEEDTLTIITYNIHHGAGVDQKLDLQRIADIIKREDPDIVAFQEVDCKASRSKGIDEPKVLGELTGYKSFFGKAINIKGGEYGNAIIAKDQEATLVKHISLPGNELRCMFAVQAKSPKGTPYVFACTHLALEEENCIKSTEIIGDWVKELKVPSILVGDMNCTTESPIYSSFTQTWDGTWGNKPLPTFPARKPRSAIDHCFTYPKQAWEVKEIKVIEEPVASDHRPLKVTLVLK
ncbi:Endonuclease/exonuclease/phosphatase [Piromyces finnis]|uniref:Endonuclease/exonuclease/phosphatase n=1 Tax=Piromyces finnis TaxID=1754191 RepID=A0A1Y1UZX3_9FUNG|nr:Endonuclease/exonuclease/phosphatase [Piromyces finnis]|eukprot:ORX43410.1 Endonuclease/exonuclease/phosphatase [Piromyces finnis]